MNDVGYLLDLGGLTRLSDEPPQPPPSPIFATCTAIFDALMSETTHSEQNALLDALRGFYAHITDENERHTFESNVYQVIKRGEDAQKFIASCPVATTVNPFSASLSMADLMALPPKTWLVDSVIGAGDMGMIYGGSGSGKTFVVIDLIGAMCTGDTFANRFSVQRPLNVAYCAGEGVSGLPARFKSMMTARGIDTLDNFRVWRQAPQLACDSRGQRMDGNIRQFLEAYQTELIEQNYQPLDVLVIDTLHSATAGADENSAADMGRVLESCREAIRALGCAVILVHHTGKNGDSERGSSALRGAMDSMIHIKRISEDSTKTSMLCTKLKDGEGWSPLVFDLVTHGDSVAIQWSDSNDDTISGKQGSDRYEIVEILRSGKLPLTARQIGQRIGKGESTQVYKLLKQLTDNGLVVASLRDKGAATSKSNPWVYELAK